MKKLEITYRPIHFLPFHRTVSGSFPKNWGEITAPQLIAIACLYKGGSSDLRFLKTMSGLPMRVLKRTDDYERFKLIEQIEFIGDRRPFHEFIIKELPSPVSGLRSPDSKLKGITFGQFIFADTYFGNYQETQNEDDLNKFIAALYLPEGKIFSEKHIQENFKAVGNLDKNTREAICINWQLIHEWLSLAYPLIFQKKEELTHNPEPGTRDSSIWLKIFQNFVGDDILHDDQWADKPINTIFTYMTRKYKENARRKN